MEGTDKKKLLESTLSQIERQFGKGSIMILGKAEKKIEISVIPTGSLSLDIATGIGGIPRGRITEIYGAEASGKTTIALHVVASAQKLGGIAAFIDAEHALDVKYAEKLGVKVDELIVSQPDYGEQALEIVESLARSGAVDLIVVDSVAALVPKAELEGEMDEQQVASQARLMSKAMRKLAGILSKSNTAIIFINQTRMKVGVMSFGGPPETTPGGMALKFYATLRLDVRRVQQIKEGDEILGHRVKIKVVKNKLAPPFKEVEVDIYYGEGISRESELIDLGLAFNLIEKSGSWFSYKGERLGQGRENVRRYLKERKDIADELEAKIRELAGFPPHPALLEKPEGSPKAKKGEVDMVFLSQAELQGLKERLSGLKILVCGDVILDRYFFGKVERISPEAPVPVFEIEKITHSLGGAGNVAANIACLGCQVELLGVIGDDEKGKTFRELAKSLGIGTSGILPEPQRPTTIKTRIIAQAQQLLRIDREEKKPLTPEIRAKLQRIYLELLETSNGVIISDYAKGMFLSQGFTAWLIGEARVKGKPVFVDPKSENWKKYESATTITPNLKEFRAVAKFEGLNPEDLEGASHELVKRFNLEFLVVTLGKDGIFLYQPDRGSQRFPARAREVYDVSGAGDTAIASLCAFLLSGLPLEQAVELANICAGIVVGKLGTQPVYFHELENYFKEGGEHG